MQVSEATIRTHIIESTFFSLYFLFVETYLSKCHSDVFIDHIMRYLPKDNTLIHK